MASAGPGSKGLRAPGQEKKIFGVPESTVKVAFLSACLCEGPLQKIQQKRKKLPPVLLHTPMGVRGNLKDEAWL